MKIRWIPVVITAVLSAIILVGGWYVYRNVSTMRPLEQIAAAVPGVQEAKPVINGDSVTIELKLNKDADVRDVYDTIAREGESIIGSRELKLQIEENANQKLLDDVWSSVLFDVAQAMDHRNYSQIPAAMKRVEQQFQGVKASSEMDDVNVYITLVDDDSAKHIVLPRKGEQLGAWPNA